MRKYSVAAKNYYTVYKLLNFELHIWCLKTMKLLYMFTIIFWKIQGIEKFKEPMFFVVCRFFFGGVEGVGGRVGGA